VLFMPLIIAAGFATGSPAVVPDPLLVRPRHAAIDDATIVAIFDVANTYDIETASIAVKKATTTDIRDFASMLVRAHTDARAKGRALAARLHVTPTPPAVNPLKASHDSAMTRLRSLNGKAFDRAFLENEVAYHKTVIAAVQNTFLPAIQNAELKSFVTNIAPVFVQHEQVAEKLLADMK